MKNNKKRFSLTRQYLNFSLLLVSVCLAPAVNAEIDIAVSAGQSFIDNGDLKVDQGNTHLNFSNVSWSDHSFESPILYGARIAYWFNSAPNWGVSVDYTHQKNYLNQGNVHVSGTRSDGSAVNGVEPIGNTIQDFNMSHGVNTITFNGQYRWFPAGKRDESLLGRMQIYSGLGAGFSIPHVEATIDNVKTYEYQAAAGPVVNGMLGVNYDIYGFLSGFAEYKLSYVSVEDNLVGGGILSTETVNHQLMFGLAAHFDP